MLANLDCSTRIGIEPNPSAVDKIFDFLHFTSPKNCFEKLGSEGADVIVSNNALEPTLNLLEELKSLRPLLEISGVIHFIVPCDSVFNHYNPKDINNHLFSWSPQNIGNVFIEVGYELEYTKP